MSKITLQCVKEKSKLRIKFFSFTDITNKVYTNVYDNTLNCKFPKDIRQEGLYYEIGSDDLTLVSNPNVKPFYTIKTSNIKIINTIDISNLKIFEVNECVICLSNPSTKILIPCAHRCLCNDCYIVMQRISKCCPLCRRNVQMVID